MSTEVSNAQVMTYEAGQYSQDIKTMLFLLQAGGDSPSKGAEAVGSPSEGTETTGDLPSSGAENGSTPAPKWYTNLRAYLTGIDKLVAQFDMEKEKVWLRRRKTTISLSSTSAGWKETMSS
jgi:hypothetical protein